MRSSLILMILVSLLSVAKTNAQLGVQAGAVAVPDPAFIPYDSIEKVSGAIGYSFGLFYKHWLTDRLSIQPGLNLLNKRWWEELDDGSATYITRISMNYLELALPVVLTTNKTKGFFLGGGPSLMMGLSGRRTVTQNGDLIEDDKIKIGSVSAPEKKLTIAIGATIGYTFKRVSVGLNYTKGITNQPASSADHGNVSNLTLRTSFLFGKQ